MGLVLFLFAIVLFQLFVDFFILSFFVAADLFFYVFEIVAVFLRGEGDAVVGVGDEADAVARDFAVLRIGRGDLQAVEEKGRRVWCRADSRPAPAGPR